MLPKKVEIQPLYDRETFIIDCHFRVYPNFAYSMLRKINQSPIFQGIDWHTNYTNQV